VGRLPGARETQGNELASADKRKRGESRAPRERDPAVDCPDDFVPATNDHSAIIRIRSSPPNSQRHVTCFSRITVASCQNWPAIFYMRFLLPAVLASSVVLPCAAGPIDFTPTSGQRVLENVVFPQLIFHQDGHAITYEQPHNWTVTGSAAQLKLTPPNISQAQATIEQVALATAQAFDEVTAAALRQVVLGSIPGDAQNAKIVLEEQNPVAVNQQPSYAVTANYSYFGQDYAVSVLFANLGQVQIRAKLVARKADFDALHRAFRGSLYSLHWE